MTKKVYDLAVKVGSYVKDGKEKHRYQNVGAVLENNEGGKFILLDRTFSPAGCLNPDNKSTVLISMFDPKSNGDKQDSPAATTTKLDDNDIIPF